jgi:EAL domain-containing protein (putative c-di-GMP-specific phosphodiesterase class I)
MDSAHDAPRRVLAVDDDPALLAVYRRALTASGYQVECAPDGAAALQRLGRMAFDAVVSDVAMPGMDGLTLLRQVRGHDLDVPVILVTGFPSVHAAAEAVAAGAFRYLLKPLQVAELERCVGQAVALHDAARYQRRVLAEAGLVDRQPGDRAGLEAAFARALQTVWMAFQPIVHASTGALFGYEALLRSGEATLPHPGALLGAAERLGRLSDLSRATRRAAAAAIAGAPPDWTFFVNLHPADLADDDLFERTGALAPHASRVVLEITERALLESVPQLTTRLATLRQMGFRLAVDDLGAGYAGLSSVAQLEPEVVKVDMSLVRGIAQSEVKRKLVRSIVSVCRELGVQTVVEGVETGDELAVVTELGCDLLQGYLLGRPGPAFPQVDPAARSIVGASRGRQRTG